MTARWQQGTELKKIPTALSNLATAVNYVCNLMTDDEISTGKQLYSVCRFLFYTNFLKILKLSVEFELFKCHCWYQTNYLQFHNNPYLGRGTLLQE
jgi:hypothetical protein